jgi:hypothetical protein
VLPLACDEPAQVVGQRLLRVLDRLVVLLRSAPGLAAGADHVGQLEKLLALRLGYSEQLADDGHRERQGELVHQVC